MSTPDRALLEQINAAGRVPSFFSSSTADSIPIRISNGGWFLLDDEPTPAEALARMDDPANAYQPPLGGDFFQPVYWPNDGYPCPTCWAIGRWPWEPMVCVPAGVDPAPYVCITHGGTRDIRPAGTRKAEPMCTPEQWAAANVDVSPRPQSAGRGLMQFMPTTFDDAVDFRPSTIMGGEAWAQLNAHVEAIAEAMAVTSQHIGQAMRSLFQFAQYVSALPKLTARQRRAAARQQAATARKARRAQRESAQTLTGLRIALEYARYPQRWVVGVDQAVWQGPPFTDVTIDEVTFGRDWSAPMQGEARFV